MDRSNTTLWRRLIDDIVLAPLEPILHASPIRLKWVGFFALIGQPFFGWVWLAVFPQAFESMPLRLTVAALGLLLMWDRFAQQPDAKATEWLFGLVMWVELPALFFWLYVQNEGATVWFGSVVAMVLIYYHLTDWRLATIGLISAVIPVIVGAALGGGSALKVNFVRPEHWFVFFFAWASAMVVAISSANLRRKRLDTALTTMGIVAHELRTPLATLYLLGDALRGEARATGVPGETKRLEDIAVRIYGLSRAMNQQIDMQIANASLLRLSPSNEVISAIDTVHTTLAQYPFRNQRERDCVRLELKSDFEFKGSQRLFVQVLLNLLKNAFRALAAQQHPAAKSEICIGVCRRSGATGIIQVSDTGVGIDSRLLRRIFEPFFSTQSDTGQGLGLAFCRAVVVDIRGRISVSSTPGAGTTFSIVLPAIPIGHPKRSY
jgi:two-component system, CAI-1 autoinducer sensor kinase/phosphatase CqsS